LEVSITAAPRFAVVINDAKKPQQVHLTASGRWTGLFSGLQWQLDGRTAVALPQEFTDIFVIDK